MAGAAATAVTWPGPARSPPGEPSGVYLTRDPHRAVYQGDRQTCEQKQADAEPDAMIGQASTDPGAARRVLEMFTATGAKQPRASELSAGRRGHTGDCRRNGAHLIVRPAGFATPSGAAVIGVPGGHKLIMSRIVRWRAGWEARCGDGGWTTR